MPIGQPASADMDGSDARREPVIVSGSRIWYGPLPPPELLAEYDRAVPGFSVRLMELAKHESENRARITQIVNDEARRSVSLQMGIAVAFGTLSLVTSLWLFLQDERLAGLVFGVGGMATTLIGLIATALFTRSVVGRSELWVAGPRDE